MHEASLMRGLMTQIEQIAKAEGAQKVTKVKVWCGALSHMSAEHFAEHFDQVAAGSIAEHAKLDVTVSDDLADDRAQDIVLEKIGRAHV